MVSLLKTVVYPLSNLTWHTQAAFHSQIQSFRFSYVSILDISCHLKQLKYKKAAGHNAVLPGILKDAAVIINHPYHVFTTINLSLITITFPTD